MASPSLNFFSHTLCPLILVFLIFHCVHFQACVCPCGFSFLFICFPLKLFYGSLILGLSSLPGLLAQTNSPAGPSGLCYCHDVNNFFHFPFTHFRLLHDYIQGEKKKIGVNNQPTFNPHQQHPWLKLFGILLKDRAVHSWFNSDAPLENTLTVILEKGQGLT